MTVTLGGVTLSENLILSGLENHAGVVVNQRRTLGGVSRLQADPSTGGRTLTLESVNHVTLGQIQAVQALAAMAQPVTLIHHRGTFMVLISGVEMEASIKYHDPDVADWYSGTITLLEL